MVAPVDRKESTKFQGKRVAAASRPPMAFHPNQNTYNATGLLRLEEEDCAVSEVEVDEVLGFCTALAGTSPSCVHELRAYHVSRNCQSSFPRRSAMSPLCANRTKCISDEIYVMSGGIANLSLDELSNILDVVSIHKPRQGEILTFSIWYLSIASVAKELVGVASVQGRSTVPTSTASCCISSVYSM